MKFVIRMIKKILFAMFILYSYNLIAVNFNMVIPINFMTISLVSILDIPALILLIISYVTVF